MPVNEVRITRIVDDVDGNRVPLAYTQQRTRDLAVVRRGLYHFAGRNFERKRRDANGVIGLALRLRQGESFCQGKKAHGAQAAKQRAAV